MDYTKNDNYGNKWLYDSKNGIRLGMWKNGDKTYYKNGTYHRLDGPAWDFLNGKKLYYIEGKRYFDFLEYIQAVVKYKENNE